jgi:hypothetical protein
MIRNLLTAVQFIFGRFSIQVSVGTLVVLLRLFVVVLRPSRQILMYSFNEATLIFFLKVKVVPVLN